MPKEVKFAKFNGDGYIHIPLNGSKVLHELTNSDFTFCVLAKPDFVKPIKWTEHYEDFALFVRSGVHTGLFYSTVNRFKGNVWDNNNIEYPLNSLEYNNKIVHLVFCVNNNKKKHSLYVNGIRVSESDEFYQLDKRKSPSLPQVPKDKDFYKYPKEYSDYFMGSANPFTKEFSCFYKGKIYESAIWSTELSADEIEVLYENIFDMDLTEDFELYKSSDNLVGYWNFDIIHDDKIFDESFLEHHGFLHNVEIGTEKI